MKSCVLALVLLLGAGTDYLEAQSWPIHGHPQQTVYASPAEWPTFSTPQCHWRSETQPILSHVHFDVNAPFYAELTGPIVVPFTITLFHLDGHAYFGDRLVGVRNVVWDATGTSVSPPLIGDPMGIIIFTGHMTIDPTLPGNRLTLRGWWAFEVQVVTYFTGGDAIINDLAAPFYAMLDPTAPEGNGIRLYYAACTPFDATRPDVQYGVNLIETVDYLPIAPITAPYRMHFTTAGYGAASLPAAVFQQRLDLNLHAGIPGTILQQITQAGNIEPDVTFDPAQMGPGVHKVALFRIQAASDGQAEVNTLVVFPITVGTGTPPPGPVNCVVGPWGTVSTSVTDTPAVTSGTQQTRTETTMVLQSRPILQQPTNGGAACPVN